MSQVNSYLPESLFLAGKDQEPVRVCREEVALIELIGNFPIVAARGRGLRVGEPFAPLAELSAAARELLLSTLAANDRVLMAYQGSAVLLFGDLLSSSVLLLAVRVAHKPDSVRRTLALLGKSEFVPLFFPASSSTTLHERDRAAYQALLELFYYIDRVLGSGEALGLWTKTLTVANFAGCLLDRVALPVESVALLPKEEGRLTAFLLCLFLSLRSELANSQAQGTYDAVRLHYAVQVCQDSGDAERTGAYRFLELAAFRDISLQKTPQGWVIEADLKRNTDHTAVFARGGESVLLRVSLQPAC